MVARISATAKFSAVLQYNEKKVAQNKAQLIHTKGFLQDKSRMTLPEKMQRFQRLHDLNPRSQVNTLHISLNFNPAENLSNQQMSAIADRYMQGIGLVNQPYLVYRHDDASHPHLHIVSSLIQPDGKRIRTEKMGQKLSEPTRLAIEKDFNLLPASQKKQQLQPTGGLQKVKYGDGTTAKEAVQNVLEVVNRDYLFTSLAEYNAILRQCNVMADIGSERSRTRQHNGLYYRVLDDQGKKVGHYMKASLFSNKPTLSNLQKKFEESKGKRKEDLPSIRQKINWALAQNPLSLHEFVVDLRKDGLEVAVHKQEKNVYALTYVDNESKIAINSTDLGKNYSPEFLQKEITGAPHQFLSPALKQTPAKGADAPDFKAPQLLADLIKSQSPSGSNPQEFDEDQEIKRRPKL